MCTGRSGAFFMAIRTSEVAHQFLNTGTGLEHEVRLTLRLNLGTIDTVMAHEVEL